MFFSPLPWKVSIGQHNALKSGDYMVVYSYPSAGAVDVSKGQSQSVHLYMLQGNKGPGACAKAAGNHSIYTEMIIVFILSHLGKALAGLHGCPR